MSYQFQVNGELYIGRTLPGASSLRIFHSGSKRFMVDFNPDLHSLWSRKPSGSWSHIQPDTDLGLLETLQPQLIAACRARLSATEPTI